MSEEAATTRRSSRSLAGSGRRIEVWVTPESYRRDCTGRNPDTIRTPFTISSSLER